jgi:hypothetical protein
MGGHEKMLPPSKSEDAEAFWDPEDEIHGDIRTQKIIWREMMSESSEL